ncbi:hypothetical protein BFRIG_00800 [Peribacillus frigoritolerans]|uniref:hypothetical protein n=1 Tax=Peribacillus frigoritolerans TaxID=450367 RepID=UPI0030D0E450
MSEKLGIPEKYSREIQEIGNKLRDLENNRIYELSGAQMDGYLNTNVLQLKKMLSRLLNKIDNQSPSINDEFDDYFGTSKKE